MVGVVDHSGGCLGLAGGFLYQLLQDGAGTPRTAGVAGFLR